MPYETPDEVVEAAILHGFIRDRHLVTLAMREGFKQELLRVPAATRLCRVVMELYATRDAVIDPVAVRAAIERLGLATPEMDRYLQRVAAVKIPNAGQLMEFIEQLRVRERRERLSTLHARLGTFLGGAGGSDSEVQQLASGIIHELVEMQRQRMQAHLQPVTEVVARLANEAEQRHDLPGLLGYSLAPFDRLTTLLSGMRRGFYYGLAGAPRRGKTNLALQLAMYIAANNHIPVLFYSWEQTAQVLGARLIAKESGISPAAILGGGQPDDRPVAAAVRSAQERMGSFAPYMFLIEAGRQDTIARIRSHAYNVMQEFQTSEVALFFDYLQKIPLGEHLEDWKARTDRISTDLAELSLELNVPILAISPLDKEGCRLDERPAEEDDAYSQYHRPTMHHSVGSGDLEYDLDVAMVLAKDWKATAEFGQFVENRAKAANVDPDLLPKLDIVNLHFDKNRDAPEHAATIIQYAFFVTLNKFVELDYKLEREYRPDYHAFTKLQSIYAQLIDTGVLPLAAAGHREGR
ncbi:MAG TPA: DnaB-like helicase C-terminal domain-containing protein [bacterium]|nr:DnaB-like helicase C-terminal domain-containing protein [bacterium]